MLEKLKSLGDSAKNFFMFIVGPILAVAGIVVYLFLGNKDLKEKLAESNAEGNLKELEGEKDEIDKKANESLSDYSKLKSEYDKSGGDQT